ncbi:MAG: hypothetical protein RJA70_3314 [Pseudomonadota bacterium]|jgi:hypothetical protein
MSVANSFRARALPVSIATLLFASHVMAQGTAVAVSAAAPGAAAPKAEEESPVKVSVHGMFDHRFILYTNQINWTPSNKVRTYATPTKSGTRADLWNYPARLVGGGTEPRRGAIIDAFPPSLPRFDDVDGTQAEIRYRPLVELSNQSESVKAIIELEIGGVRFGAPSTGGTFSTDGINIETRVAYTELGRADGHRFAVGLIPFYAHEYLWKEATAGMQVQGPLLPGFDYHVAWVRGLEDRRAPLEPSADPIRPLPQGLGDNDGVFGRVNANFDGQKAGLFALYQFGGIDAEDSYPGGTDVYSEGYSLFQFPSVDFNMLSVGVDSHLAFGPISIDLDGIYQMGEFRNVNYFSADNFSADALSGKIQADTVSREECGAGTAGDTLATTHPELSERISKVSNRALKPGAVCYDKFAQTGIAVRLDAGLDLGDTKVSLVGSYISGDDNTNDADWNGFLSTDVDTFDSAIFQEGVVANDTVQDQDPYLFDKGYMLGKLMVSHKIGDLTLAAAGVYNSLAADLTWGGIYIDPAVAGVKTNPGIPDPLNEGQFLARSSVQWSGAYLGTEAQLRAKYDYSKTVQSNFVFAALVDRGPAMDFFEVGEERNGISDKGYFTVQANLQYQF